MDYKKQEVLATSLFKNTGNLLKLIKVTTTVQYREASPTKLFNTYLVMGYNPVTGWVHNFHQFDTLVKAQRKFDRLDGTKN